ncbi:MAG TPA: hypothetical protein VEG61_07605 [Candidatus Dormibacteraeota bacterium]|nr:hypothetical protein [Candidatus Dormibacteraeota bacterium]
MRKERIVPMMLLVIVLVGVLTLPQGFASKNYYGNKQTPLASFLHYYAARLQHPTQTKTYAQQSGNGLPVQASGLPSNHLLERGL